MYRVIKKTENVDVGTCMIQYCVDGVILNIKVFGTIKEGNVLDSREYCYILHAQYVAKQLIEEWFKCGYIKLENKFIPMHRVSLIEITNIEKYLINPTNVQF